MDAIKLLKDDHLEVIRLIKKLEGADDLPGTDPTDTEVFNKLHETLAMHTKVEEDHFYPAMEGLESNDDVVQDAYEAHDEVDSLLALLSTKAPKTKEFQETLHQLRNCLERHIGEEENVLFPSAEESLDADTLMEIKRQMEETKNDSKIIAGTMKQA